jgi:hypothetical protein
MYFQTLFISCTSYRWAPDLLSKYQPRHTGDLLARVPEDCLKPGASYVTLERKDDSARKILHNVIAATALGLVVAGVVSLKK